MAKDLNEFGIKSLQARNDYLLKERDRLARRVVELEAERDQLAAHNGRLRDALERAGDDYRREYDVSETPYCKALKENPSVSLAEIEAAAIERAAEWAYHYGPVDLFVKNGILDYANSIRQSAKQSGVPHDQR